MKKGLIAIGIASSALFGGIAVGVASAYACDSKQASAYNSIDDIKDDWQKFKDTYLVPLTALGISVPTVVSGVVVVINSFAKKKLKEKILEAEEKLAKADEELNKVNKVLEEIAKQSKVTDDIQNELTQLFSQVKTIVASNMEVNSHIEYYNRICKALIEIETKIASIDSNAVKAGIVKEINEIKELLKKA